MFCSACWEGNDRPPASSEISGATLADEANPSAEDDPSSAETSSTDLGFSTTLADGSEVTLLRGDPNRRPGSDPDRYFGIEIVSRSGDRYGWSLRPRHLESWAVRAGRRHRLVVESEASGDSWWRIDDGKALHLVPDELAADLGPLLEEAAGIQPGESGLWQNPLADRLSSFVADPPSALHGLLKGTDQNATPSMCDPANLELAMSCAVASCPLGGYAAPACAICLGIVLTCLSWGVAPGFAP